MCNDSNSIGLVVAMIILYIIIIGGITTLTIVEFGPLPFYLIILVVIGSFFLASIIIAWILVGFI